MKIDVEVMNEGTHHVFEADFSVTPRICDHIKNIDGSIYRVDAVMHVLDNDAPSTVTLGVYDVTEYA